MFFRSPQRAKCTYIITVSSIEKFSRERGRRLRGRVAQRTQSRQVIYYAQERRHPRSLSSVERSIIQGKNKRHGERGSDYGRRVSKGTNIYLSYFSRIKRKDENPLSLSYVPFDVALRRLEKNLSCIYMYYTLLLFLSTYFSPRGSFTHIQSRASLGGHVHWTRVYSKRQCSRVCIIYMARSASSVSAASTIA